MDGIGCRILLCFGPTGATIFRIPFIHIDSPQHTSRRVVGMVHLYRGPLSTVFQPSTTLTYSQRRFLLQWTFLRDQKRAIGRASEEVDKQRTKRRIDSLYVHRKQGANRSHEPKGFGGSLERKKLYLHQAASITVWLG